MIKNFLLLFFLFCFFENADAMDLSPRDLEEIKKLDLMYQSYSSIKSEFLQKDSLGNIHNGWFLIQKPGFARIEYTTLPIRFIANGNSLLFQDIKLKQKSFFPINASPFSYLLDKDFSFLSNKINITKYKKYDDHVEITFISNLYQNIGSLTLFLSNNGELLQWSILDAKNTVTEIFLLKPVFSSLAFSNKGLFNIQKIKNIHYSDIVLKQ